jgi:VanZ family protein
VPHVADQAARPGSRAQSETSEIRLKSPPDSAGLRVLAAAIARPRPWLRWSAALLCMVLVLAMFWLGSRPSASDLIPSPPLDKLLHFVVYGGYATLAWVASGGRGLHGVLVALAIGFTDEGLQSLAPGRVADWTDIAADVAGALAAVGVLGALRRRLAPVR